MKWSKLQALGTSKIVNTSVIWLALIPFLSRVLETLQSRAGMQVTLPFNFVAFYYAAIAFALASLVFQVFCPDLIKQAPNFGVFKAKGFSDNELKKWFNEIVSSGRTDADPKKIRDFLTRARIQVPSDVGQSDLMPQYWNAQINARVSEAYDEAKSSCDERAPVARLLATTFYAVGFLAFAIVAMGNLIVVWAQTKIWWNTLFCSC